MPHPHPRRRSQTLVALGALAAVMLLAAPAAGQGLGPPLEGSGTGVIIFETMQQEEIRAPGGNSLQNRILEGTAEGALEGDFVHTTTGMVHRNGHVTFQGTLEFTGTIAGCGDEEHTLTIGLAGRGEAGAPPGLPATTSQVRVIGGPSDTLHANGQGTLTQVGPMITYDLRYRCR